MASPQEKLAGSLEALRGLQERGIVAIRSRERSRVYRERLVKNGFLKEVMKGWYIPARPDEIPGDSTAWYASFWDFCADYLAERFGKDWCLSPEQSLLLHAGNRTVPTQLLVRTPKGGNKPTTLPHGTSLFDVRYPVPKESEVVECDGLRLYSVAAALIACPERFFRQAATDARAALATVKNSTDVLALLLEGGHSTIAGRLAGAFRNAGRDRVADEIVSTMDAAGYSVRESDPFESKPALTLITPTRETSPHVNRLRLMWQDMRQPVLDAFPSPPGLTTVLSDELRSVHYRSETHQHGTRQLLRDPRPRKSRKVSTEIYGSKSQGVPPHSPASVNFVSLLSSHFASSQITKHVTPQSEKLPALHHATP